MNALLSRLTREPQSYESLLKLWPRQRLDGMLQPIRKQLYIYRGKYHVIEVGRDVIFCVTCKEQMQAEGAYRSCPACRARATLNKQNQRKRARARRRAMQKCGKRKCNTCFKEKWLYEFKKHKSGARSPQCSKCYHVAKEQRRAERLARGWQ